MKHQVSSAATSCCIEHASGSVAVVIDALRTVTTFHNGLRHFLNCSNWYRCPVISIRSIRSYVQQNSRWYSFSFRYITLYFFITESYTRYKIERQKQKMCYVNISVTADLPRKAPSTTATMSKQHCRSNRQLGSI